jgi:hypothetical protein
MKTRTLTAGIEILYLGFGTFGARAGRWKERDNENRSLMLPTRSVQE